MRDCATTMRGIGAHGIRERCDPAPRHPWIAQPGTSDPGTLAPWHPAPGRGDHRHLRTLAPPTLAPWHPGTRHPVTLAHIHGATLAPGTLARGDPAPRAIRTPGTPDRSRFSINPLGSIQYANGISSGFQPLTLAHWKSTLFRKKTIAKRNKPPHIPNHGTGNTPPGLGRFCPRMKKVLRQWQKTCASLSRLAPAFTR
jgi:hypothetical protein